MAEIRSGVNISIGANADVLERVFAQAQQKASSFEKSLAKAAAGTAAAYAALKVAIFNSLEAFAEQERIGNQLNQSLKNSGIYTQRLRDDYEELSVSIGRLIGADDDAVKSAFAKSQAYLGSIEITKELAEAAADLAVATGETLDEALVKIAKTVTTDTNALAKLGIEVNKSSDDHTRLSSIIDQLESRWGGQARASQGVSVAFSNLKNVIGDLYEEIGAQLAPAAVSLANSLTKVIEAAKNNAALIKLVTIVGTSAAALVAAVSACTALAGAFSSLMAILAPVGTALAAVAAVMATPFAAGSIAIAGMVATVVGGLTAIMVKGESFMSLMQKIKSGVSGLFGGGENKQEAQPLSTAEQEKVDANRKAQERIEQDRRDHVQRLELIERNQAGVTALQYQENTKRLVDLKNQENQILKQLDETRNAQVRQSLQDALSQNRQQQEFEQQERLARIQQFAQIETQAKADAMALGFQIETDLTLAQRNQLLEGEMTEAEAKRQIYQQMIRDRIEANNRFLQEQAKFGTAFATINEAINSRQVQGAKSASSELIALTESKNATLKAIGKISAVSSIAISSAEAAMNVYKGFSGIPIVGPALGIAGALAALAFGKERIVQVNNAAEGGLVTGGIPGVDSVPIMAMPGELIIPKKLTPTFQDVMGSGKLGGDNSQIVSELQALRSEIGAVRPNLVTINGDVMSDDSFVDRLIQKISDRLEFGNARLAGVNS